MASPQHAPESLRQAVIAELPLSQVQTRGGNVHPPPEAVPTIDFQSWDAVPRMTVHLRVGKPKPPTTKLPVAESIEPPSENPPRSMVSELPSCRMSILREMTSSAKRRVHVPGEVDGPHGAGRQGSRQYQATEQ